MRRLPPKLKPIFELEVSCLNP